MRAKSSESVRSSEGSLELRKFSIITPSFRQLDFLKNCVASVSDQAGVEIEHIIQDAESGPELREWIEMHSEATLYVERDEGMYDAINRGLKKSSGDILAWLNCDEQYLPGTLAKVADFFKHHPDVDILFGDALLVDLEGQALSYRRMVRPRALHTRLLHLGTLSCSTFFRRKLVDKGFLFKPHWKSIGDAVWMHDLLKGDVSMAVLNEPLAVFAFTGENLSGTDKAKRESEEWRNEKDAPPNWLRWPAMFGHRWSKFWAGAYLKRDLEYQIYEKNSNARMSFKTTDLGWTWPSSL